MMEIFTYANCTSCRNAEALATKHGIEATKRDIFKERLSVDELEALFERIGTTPGQMIATRSRPYRDLGLADKNLSDDEILVLMAEYPALIRRPIVVTGSTGQVGFNHVAMEEMIGRLTSMNNEGNEHA
jgi:Spx/MgsR family transcriptional regulator